MYYKNLEEHKEVLKDKEYYDLAFDNRGFDQVKLTYIFYVESSFCKELPVYVKQTHFNCSRGNYGIASINNPFLKFCCTMYICCRKYYKSSEVTDSYNSSDVVRDLVAALQNYSQSPDTCKSLNEGPVMYDRCIRHFSDTFSLKCYSFLLW